MELQQKEIEILLYDDDVNISEWIKNSVYDFLNFSGMSISDPDKKCLNCPMSFDIETSSFIDKNRPTDDQYVVLPYTWQFGIYNHVLIGRYIQDFNDVLDGLQYFLKSEKIKQCKIYIHNINFEFFHTYRVLKNVDKKLLAYSKRNLIQFTIHDEISVKSQTIIFNDSYLLSQCNLKDTAEMCVRQIRKQPPIDYYVIRLPETPLSDTELQYCAYDVYAVNEYIYELLSLQLPKDIFKNFCDIPTTATGIVRKRLAHSIGFRSKNKTPEQLKYFNYLKKCNIKDFDQLKVFREIYSGGFTHASFGMCGKILKDVYHFDFTSSYPTVLLSEMYPMSSFSDLEVNRDKTEVNNKLLKKVYKNKNLSFFKNILFNTSVEQLRKKHIGFYARVKFFNIKLKPDVFEGILSVSKFYISGSDEETLKQRKLCRQFNGRLISHDFFECFLTDVDFYEVKKFYDFDNIKIYNCQIAKFDYLPFLFKREILIAYKQKTVLKDVVGSEIQYQHYKSLLNSFYGMTVSDPVRSEYEIKDYDITEVFDETEKQQEDKIKYANNNNQSFLYYPWGVWCTAYARSNLFTAIIECGSDYIYSDTDSVFIQNYQKHKTYFEKYDENIKNKIQKSIDMETIRTDFEFELQENNILNNISDVTEMERQLSELYNDYKTENNKKELETLYNECCNKYGKFKPLGIWSSEKPCKRFITLGAKRYLEEYFDVPKGKTDNIQFTFSGIKKDALLKYFRKNYPDNDAIFMKLQEIYNSGIDVTLDNVNSDKSTNFYIDHCQSGVMSDNCFSRKGEKYQGVNYQYQGYGGYYFAPVPFEIKVSESISDFMYGLNYTMTIDKKLGRTYMNDVKKGDKK